MRVRARAWQSAKKSSSATMEKFGWSRSWARVRRFISRYPRTGKGRRKRADVKRGFIVKLKHAALRREENMRQRSFFCRFFVTALLALCFFLTSPWLSGAQSAPYRIGVLTPGLASEAVFRGREEELGRVGYRAGKDITYMIEDTQGNLSNLGGPTKKLVDAKPHALFTVGTAHSLAAQQATTTLPIVFAYIADPVRAGLIASYQLSKNNLTGVGTYAGPLSAKRLEMLKEIAPATKRVLMIISSIEAPGLE